MKRKKPPIALISVLVVSILGLVIAGKAFSFYNLSMEEQQQQLQKEAEERARAAPPVVDNSAKKPDSAAVEAMKAKMKVGTPRTAAAANAVDPSDRHFKTAVPTVIMPDEALQKPKPNSAAPTTQWYDKK
jgi:hypothetical protein